MAMTYTGTNGLFTRLGALVYFMDAVRTHQTNLKALFANVQGEYSAADRYMIDQLSGNLENRISEAGGVLNDVRSAAEKTIIEMCFAEASTSTTNAMRAKQLQDALLWLIRQMDADVATVNGTTVTKSALSVGASNNGNGTFAYLFDAPNVLLGSTADWPNIRTELLEARCVQDAQDGSISSGNEVFEIRGQPSYNGLDYRFPAGSGTLMRINSICANIDNGVRGQNVLTNSDLEDWTSNTPDQFTVSTGTAGTEFAPDATTWYRGAKCLKANVSANKWKILQQLGSGSGSLGKVTPDRPYLLTFAAKKDAGATGTLRVSLMDSGGSVIDSGNFALSQSVAALSTSWAITKLAWRTPRVLPTSVYLAIETTTAIGTAACYIDEVCLAEMMPIAPGGPAVGISAGSSDWFVDDNARYSFTNNAEGLFVTAFDRLFDMYNKGLSLPQNYAAGETISDALIA